MRASRSRTPTHSEATIRSTYHPFCATTTHSLTLHHLPDIKMQLSTIFTAALLPLVALAETSTQTSTMTMTKTVTISRVSTTSTTMSFNSTSSYMATGTAGSSVAVLSANLTSTSVGTASSVVATEGPSGTTSEIGRAHV